jgi:ABC-type Fe3+-hydroxamate transport system substrate-binding protein
MTTLSCTITSGYAPKVIKLTTPYKHLFCAALSKSLFLQFMDYYCVNCNSQTTTGKCHSCHGVNCLKLPAKRIVSLVPSQTELLYDLGLDEKVIGITKFCVHPETWFRNKKRVGGTKTVHIDIVKELQPDLIIANKEENTKEQIEELSRLFPVWVSDIQTIPQALHMMEQVGIMTGKQTDAQQLIVEITNGFNNIPKTETPKQVAYFIWRAPWMCAGGDTFISHMIEAMGWQNALADTARYPEVLLEDLQTKRIDTVLLSSEPYPFKDKHIAEIKAVLPNVEVLLVDGEMFSWYGSRMLLAPEYLKGLISQAL